jgi:hypothetical protein
MGNGFEFEDGKELGAAAFGKEELFSPAKGLTFAAAGNGFVVWAPTGNGFVEFIIGNGFVPGRPLCVKNGFAPVGAGCSGLLGPKGESPVACCGVVVARKGFAPVI